MSNLKELIYKYDKPKQWREGQFVFNMANRILGEEIVRKVQFEDGIDCFYNDSKIDDFINACTNRIYGN